jgi:subtilisin family serine protease
MVTANPKPHAVTNSWGGGSGQTWYNSQVSAWRQANIIPVFAIGNAGSSCRSANSPGDQPNLISVGATTTTDAMASFSSRGTSTAGLMKPEVSAPGNQIVSCGTGTNNYATMSGTSMATPHVAGVIALYLSANPGSTYQQVYDALIANVAHPTLTSADRNCGLPTPGQDFPNNAFGYGRVDAAYLGN